MKSTLVDQVRDALLSFTSVSRLYDITIDNADLPGALLVEAFAAQDGVQELGHRDVIVLSTSAHVHLGSLLGKPARLDISLANRQRTAFHGIITGARSVGSNGGLARYRLRLSPWLFQLSRVRNSRAWENKSVIDIVDAVLEGYQYAQWRWSGEVGTFMEDAAPRSYCCQYRESDLDFVKRLLTAEGLAWRFEDTEDGQRMVIFADSSQESAVPEDASSAEGGGIRYHAARAGETGDTVQSLTTGRSLMPSHSSLLSYDYKTKNIVAASVPTKLRGGKQLPVLEHFETPGHDAFTTARQAQRYAVLYAEAREARAARWTMRSTVRTLRAGTRMTLLNGPLARDGASPAYTVLRVRSVGVNNLPAPASEALAELFGPIPDLLQQALPQADLDYLARALTQANASGYANWFDAIAAGTPWRPLHRDSSGEERSHYGPTAMGSQRAVVVGADGNTVANGADELYCDALGRVRIRFHWQDPSDRSGCWVRVAQRSAGSGMGCQFLPRIGMAVLVQFIENDIDHPLVVSTLYDGQGEGGTAPTPGGKAASGAATTPFKAAHDHAASGQGNLAGGNSPLWHGASADTAGHRNSSAQWGVRSKEFGGYGYNQLLFDDTDAQGRVQLKSSHAASELTLGHLVHNAGNYRGSFRGLGAELRTDGYGAVRAGAGLLVSSYRMQHAAGARDPAGDNAAGIAMMKLAVKLGEAFSHAAVTHRTVGLAGHLGAAKPGGSVLNAQAAPLKSALEAVSGMVSGDNLNAARADGAAKSVAAEDGKLPHTTDPVIVIAAQAGLGLSSGQSIQLASGETVTLMSGQDSELVAGGQLRLHTGQASGMLGGAVGPGAEGLGLQLIAAQGAVDVQAQSDVLNIQARDLIDIISANAHIDWAAAKSISLSTADGANITISGGNITVQCPGKITIHAGKKSFTGPARTEYLLPVMPKAENNWADLEAFYDDAWNTPWPLDQVKLELDGKAVAKSVSVNPLK